MLVLLVGVAAWWSSYYGNHQVASVTIRFLHLAGLIMGGGTGLFADRQVLRAARSAPGEREAVLATLSRAHAHVISWILIVGITGALMTAADTATFLASKVYWAKMILVGLLIANGVALFFVERRTRRLGAASEWSRLVIVSTISAVLWLVTLFMGTLLTVAA
ncbi:MAG: hypothetical protein LAP85_11405 [Acidobacteriia bacterium]|nr:hypothetical protein [Terriglobia bacterium]